MIPFDDSPGPASHKAESDEATNQKRFAIQHGVWLTTSAEYLMAESFSVFRKSTMNLIDERIIGLASDTFGHHVEIGYHGGQENRRVFVTILLKNLV